MRTENIFIAHPTTTAQINALKAVVKAFNVKFEIKKEPYIEADEPSKEPDAEEISKEIPDWQKELLTERLDAIAENPERIKPIKGLFDALNKKVKL